MARAIRSRQERIVAKRNPVYAPANPRRECEKAMQAAEDIAEKARQEITAIAAAHYENCEVCQQAGKDRIVNRLVNASTKRIEAYCEGVY